MFEKEIPVLLVDDDPDVLAISRLAMRNFEVFGLPITLYTADSKAAAIELLESRFALQAQVGAKLNVAFIDVVVRPCVALKRPFVGRAMAVRRHIVAGEPREVVQVAGLIRRAGAG